MKLKVAAIAKMALGRMSVRRQICQLITTLLVEFDAKNGLNADESRIATVARQIRDNSATICLHYA
jgi:hypothetical protein